jgi:hypothetical protein
MMGMDLTLLAVLAFFAFLVLSLVAFGIGMMMLSQRQLTRQQDREHELKRELVAKGLSADEIERIIKVTAGEAAPRSRVPPETGLPKGAGADRARLVQVLCKHEMEAGDVERLLRAVGEHPDDELPAKVAAIESMLEYEMEVADIERVMRAFQRAPGPPDLAPDKGQTAFRQ